MGCSAYPKAIGSNCYWHAALPLYAMFTHQALCGGRLSAENSTHIISNPRLTHRQVWF